MNSMPRIGKSCWFRQDSENTSCVFGAEHPKVLPLQLTAVHALRIHLPANVFSGPSAKLSFGLPFALFSKQRVMLIWFR